MFDRRREPRVGSNLTVLIWGVDKEGMRFSQSALARNISQNGALLTGINRELRPGDLVAVQHGETRARYRVVWARNSGTEEKTQVAVQKIDGQLCPWLEELAALSAAANAARATGFTVET